MGRQDTGSIPTSEIYRWILKQDGPITDDLSVDIQSRDGKRIEFHHQLPWARYEPQSGPKKP